MVRCTVSEHTLELNVCCSMVEDLRKTLGVQAYAFGYTLRHEGVFGLDVSIQAPPSVNLLSLQFKKPLRCSFAHQERRYEFPINDNRWRDQHFLLLLLSLALNLLGKSASVYYALPAICDVPELEQKLPALLEEVFFVNVLDVPLVELRRCKLRVSLSSSPRVTFHCSAGKDVKFYTWSQIRDGIKEVAVSVEDLQRAAEVEYEELERVLLSYLEERAPPWTRERIIGRLRSRHMRELITAVGVQRGRETRGVEGVMHLSPGGLPLR